MGILESSNDMESCTSTKNQDRTIKCISAATMHFQKKGLKTSQTALKKNIHIQNSKNRNSSKLKNDNICNIHMIHDSLRSKITIASRMTRIYIVV